MGEALCYKSGNVNLAYKKAGDYSGMLVYKSHYSNVYISWGDYARDLDICAYWIGFPEGKVGWSWSQSGQQKKSEDGTFRLTWYGDNTGYSGSEKLLPSIVPWDKAVSHVLRVHFNWYPSGMSGNCTVRATSSDGKTDIVLENVRCGARGGKADVNDPYVNITFDEKGNVVSVIQ